MKVARVYEQSDKEKERSKRGRSARRRGHQFERDIVNLLKAILPDGFKAQRMLQSRDGALPDVEIFNDGGPLIHIEAKKHKKPNIRKAFEQAWDRHKPGVMPMAVTQADRDFILVTMRWQDFADMLVVYLKETQTQEG